MGLFGGKSTYAYVINNPLIGIDPLELTNLTLGANVSAIAGGGFTAGGGLYVSYGAGGFDVGVYGSVGGGIGANIGVGISGGYVPGSSSNLSGQTVDANLSGGTFQCTGSVAVDPNLTGSGSVGLGLGLLAGASLTTTQSGHFGLQDAEGWFSDHFGSKCH
ncbi:hypothetical protein EC912_103435 [Luteibacter rhizovicinus]|uniref:RHS repeat-associated protein n=2 Tax=Luteibacter rhizovicinus TaxID=242606 RepID=A0A4R3YRE4_9GAMM|nr:hypothetical protein EC912_103435 [Luteibacter rhizovicinus]